MTKTLTVAIDLPCTVQKAWLYYTSPEHITQWNFAEDSWHCPHASNDLRVGGQYLAKMAAKDGSFEFDFTAIYTMVELGKHLEFTLFDNRHVVVDFVEEGEYSRITVTFDAENTNPIEVQQQGWQNILNHLQDYAKKHA